MKLSEVFNFKMKNGSSSKLDRSLDVVLALLEKRRQLQEQARVVEEQIQQKVAQDVAAGAKGGAKEIFSELEACRAELVAVDGLVRKGENEALQNIGSERKKSFERLQRLDKKIASLCREISIRRVSAIAAFVASEGLDVVWPTEHNGGHIGLPVMPEVQSTEMVAIAQDTQCESPTDDHAVELAEARAERERLNALNRATPEDCLRILLQNRKRAV